MDNIVDLIKNINNPQEFVLSMLKNNGNPILSNMVSLAQKGNYNEVEKIARNLCKERGIDYDKEIGKLLVSIK